MTTQQPFIIFLTGASGAGKTMLLKTLAHELDAQTRICLHFDDIIVPTHEEMIKNFGSASAWQKAATLIWIQKILREYSQYKVVLIEGQVNLDFIHEAMQQAEVQAYKIILIDCDPQVRHERLRHERRQPELVNAEMDNWSAFLKRQAEDQNALIIDNSQPTFLHALARLKKALTKL